MPSRRASAKDRAVAYSVGYEGRTLETFLGTLQDARLTCLVDVRDNPVSRKAGFSRRRLAQAVEGAGITYVHLRALGAPRQIRDAWHEDGDKQAFLAAYRRHLAKHAPELEHLVRLCRSGTTAFMCYEADEEECHRQVLAATLQDEGVAVARL